MNTLRSYAREPQEEALYLTPARRCFSLFQWQQEPAFPLAWIGGQGTVPYEQNTQQSPLFGLSNVWQLVHS